VQSSRSPTRAVRGSSSARPTSSGSPARPPWPRRWCGRPARTMRLSSIRPRGRRAVDRGLSVAVVGAPGAASPRRHAPHPGVPNCPAALFWAPHVTSKGSRQVTLTRPPGGSARGKRRGLSGRLRRDARSHHPECVHLRHLALAMGRRRRWCACPLTPAIGSPGTQCHASGKSAASRSSYRDAPTGKRLSARRAVLLHLVSRDARPVAYAARAPWDARLQSDETTGGIPS
jgi:hypothetical protein